MIEDQFPENQTPDTPQQYIVATEDVPPEHIPHLVRLPLALRETPMQVCGIAHRVGYVPVAQGKHALYRLKLRMSLSSRKTATLPALYVLEQGVFIEYMPAHTSPRADH